MALSQADVYGVLKNCRDPEISVNLVDLGLVYGVELQPSETEAGKEDVLVRMTLTSPGCPMSHAISHDVTRKLHELEGVASARVEIVWEPAWHPGMITEDGRRQLQIA